MRIETEFDIGDMVWPVQLIGGIWKADLHPGFTIDHFVVYSEFDICYCGWHGPATAYAPDANEEDSFATLEEAQAEAKRRNEAPTKLGQSWAEAAAKRRNEEQA